MERAADQIKNYYRTKNRTALNCEKAYENSRKSDKIREKIAQKMSVLEAKTKTLKNLEELNEKLREAYGEVINEKPKVDIN